MGPSRRRILLAAFTIPLVFAGCSRGEEKTAPSGASPAPLEMVRLEAPGLHNLYRVTDSIYSGSSPEGDAGFQSLRRLGVRTVITVDGARPDVEAARRHGLRYVHLPFGYDGIPERQALRIAKAVRDLPGPVYIHCHHGKHRGPAAAAVARLCLDERCGIEGAVAVMRRAGTDPHYTGLHAAPRRLRRPMREELDHLPADFPEAVDVGGLAQAMVGLDETLGRIEEGRAAGWKAPPAHPDLDPPHEALQLVEHYREAARLPEVKAKPEEFRRWLEEAEGAAEALEKALRRDKEGGRVDAAGVGEAFRRVTASCTRCHARYRDVPGGR